MLTSIRQSLAPPLFQDEEATRMARLLNAILLTWLASVVVMQIGLLFTDLNLALRLASGGSATLLIFGLMYMMRRGRVRLASALMASATGVFFVLLTIAFGGVGEPAFSGYVAAVLTAGLLLGGRAGIASAAFGVVAGWGILIGEVNGLLPPPAMVMTLPFAWMAMSLGFIVGATILHLATYGMTEALEQARRNERALNRANEALQREIAERKSTELALQESERRYRRIVEEASDPVYTTDLQGRFSYVNLPAQKLSGYPEDDLIGMHFTDMIPKAWRERVLSFYQKQFQDRVRDTRLEFPTTTKAGETKWVEQSVTLLIDGDLVTGFQSIVRDVTERVRAEEALRKARDELESRMKERTAELANANAELSIEIRERVRAEEALRLRNAILSTQQETSLDGILVVDEGGKMISFNQRFVEMWGIPAEVVESRSGERALQSVLEKLAEPEEFLARVRYLYANRSEKSHEEILLADGSTFERYSAPMSGQDTYYGRVWYFRDITERVVAEEALRQHTTELQARNEELDAYAHTVAHDLKGPAGIIIGFAEALEENLEATPPGELRRHLRTIARNGRKMSNITDELLLLASVRKVAEVEMKPLDMSEIVTGALDRLSDLAAEHRAHVALPEEWPIALGYAPWVEEVWVNYLSNAIKYGGRPPNVELGARIGHGDSVRFWVRDNGSGLTEEEQERLFTPFLRLDQAHAKGHGLGLSIARRIVEKLDGQVGVESRRGQGSTFFFTLPSRSIPPPAPFRGE